ncbi:MAG TPA: hypothetical protein VHM90_13145 [Phycisphaerae bacterium]|nr:hypothetical protein [Phycisphaerae bacterium]
MRTFAPALLLALLSTSTSAFAASPIPKISTAAELRAQTPTRLATGFNVRLGITDVNKDAGPFLLLYADVESKSPADLPHNRDPHEWLGPLFVRAQWDDLKRTDEQVEARPGEMQSGLYALAIPVRKGTCHLTIDDGTNTIWDEKIQIDAVPPSPWQPFVGLGKTKTIDGARASEEAWAAIPRLEGGLPLLNLAEFAAGHKDAEALFKKSLPLSMPLDPTWASATDARAASLKLGLADATFTLAADGRKMLNWPDEVLLARWWVGGKAVYPDATMQNALQQHMARAMSETDKMTIAFGYPEYLHATEGDTLALQVLYSPRGYAQVATGEPLVQAAINSKENLPLLSNRLEFKLTRELIAARDKATAK